MCTRTKKPRQRGLTSALLTCFSDCEIQHAQLSYSEYCINPKTLTWHIGLKNPDKQNYCQVILKPGEIDRNAILGTLERLHFSIFVNWADHYPSAYQPLTLNPIQLISTGSSQMIYSTYWQEDNMVLRGLGGKSKERSKGEWWSQFPKFQKNLSPSFRKKRTIDWVPNYIMCWSIRNSLILLRKTTE